MHGTRHAILDAFADQLLEVGYLGVSLEEIAREVGVRKPSLYHHFPAGKEAIFAAVATRMIDEVASRLAVALDTPGGLRPRLEALATIHAADPRGAALDQRIFDATRAVSDEVRAEVSEHYVRSLLHPVEAMMAKAVEDGELAPRDPGLLATAFLELAQATVALPDDVGMPPDRRGGEPAPAHTVAQEVVEIFLHGAAVRDTG